MSVVPIWCLPRPFSQNTDFSKKALKTNKFWKIQKFFLHFWWQFYRAFQWYIVCFHTFSGCWYTEGNVFAVKSHSATTAQYLTKGKLIIVWKFFFWFYANFQKFRSFHGEKLYFWQKFEAIRTFLGGILLAILPSFCHF